MAIVGHKSGALYWWTSTHVAPLDLFATIYRGPATFLRNENFAERTWVRAGLEHAGGPVGAVSFRGMVGDGAFLNAYIVRTPSSEIADRAPVDGVVLRASAVRPGTYTIRWYDPVTGAVIAERAAVADAQGLRLELPVGIARGVAVKAFPSWAGPAPARPAAPGNTPPCAPSPYRGIEGPNVRNRTVAACTQSHPARSSSLTGIMAGTRRRLRSGGRLCGPRCDDCGPELPFPLQ